jgi:hypothetical protein
MCALVLAVRKVPIYGPGGGGAALGSMDAPSYSVSVSPDDAAKYRSDFSDQKDAKRLMPTKKTETDTQSMAGTDYSGVTAHHELRAVQALNARNPVVDRARDDAFAARENSSEATLADERRSLDEVRGLLTRESTRGRRHPSQLSPVIEPPTHQTYPMMPPAATTQYAPPPLSAPHIPPIPANAFSSNVQRRDVSSPRSQGFDPTSSTSSPPSRSR